MHHWTIFDDLIYEFLNVLISSVSEAAQPARYGGCLRRVRKNAFQMFQYRAQCRVAYREKFSSFLIAHILSADYSMILSFTRLRD